VTNCETDQAALAEILAEITGRVPGPSTIPSVERVRRAAELLGNPQHAFRVVHLTGTNGKTSTARMVESLVRAHGLRTGLFTSPHLTSVTERIQVEGTPLSATQFMAAYRRAAPCIEATDREFAQAGEQRLSFFEVLTLLAFVAFAEAPVDVAVIEVGMGGQWDATNVADGEVAVVTPIDLDHMEWLGNTTAKIARTKAGIIKPGATAVISQQPADAATALAQRASEVGACLVREGVELELISRKLTADGQVIDLRTTTGCYPGIFLPLPGEHMGHNALLALGAVEALLGGEGKALDAAVVAKGFAAATSPGRLELMRTAPPVLVDVAHNPHGIAALTAALRESFPSLRFIGVVSVMADKDAAGILAALEPVLAEVVLTRNSSERSLPPDDLRTLALNSYGAERLHLVDSLTVALEAAIEAAAAQNAEGVSMGVLVTGSVVTAADARALLLASVG